MICKRTETVLTKRSDACGGPGTSYAKVGILSVGESVRVIQQTGSWSKQQSRPEQPGRFVYGLLLYLASLAKVTLLVAALCFVGLSVPADSAAAQEYCTSADFPFASCPDVPLNYQAVIVAVHGWNGSCSGTFGTGDESIFRVLRRDNTHFYDFDCFQYNSRETSLADNARALSERIVELKNLGYKHAMLITHSTGGILALQMLTDSLLEPDNNERLNLVDEPILNHADGIRVPAVQAWATPINGLKRHITIAGRLLTLVGYSPETLPDLEPDSMFLTTLKERLKILGEMPKHLLSLEARQRLQDISINFYHGQDEDLVIQEIDKDQARKIGWLWPIGRGDLVDTGTGHSHNVSDSGRVGTPRFTGRSMEIEAMLRLPFRPRYDEVFPENLHQVSLEREMRQIQIIEALTFYARHSFADTVFPAIDFLKTMMTNPSGGARSKKVDEYLVDDLLKYFRERAPDDDFVRFLIGFGRNVLNYYDPTGPVNVAALGYNEADVVRAMMKLVLFTLGTVSSHLHSKTEENQENLLTTYNYNSLKEFEKDMHTVLGLFLVALNHTIQKDAVEYSAQVIERSTPEVLRDSPLLDSLHDFYAGKYRKLPQDVKTNIINAVALAMNKDPELRENLLEKWSIEVPYIGQQRPLWATLNDDEAVARIVDNIQTTETLKLAEWKFLADVASSGGARGNSLGVARSAQQKLFDMVNEGRVLPVQLMQYGDILNESGRTAVYPSIGRQLLDSSNDLWRFNDRTIQ